MWGSTYYLKAVTKTERGGRDKFVVHFWRNQVVGTGSRVVSRSTDMSELVAVSVCPFIAL